MKVFELFPTGRDHIWALGNYSLVWEIPPESSDRPTSQQQSAAAESACERDDRSLVGTMRFHGCLSSVFVRQSSFLSSVLPAFGAADGHHPSGTRMLQSRRLVIESCKCFFELFTLTCMHMPLLMWLNLLHMICLQLQLTWSRVLLICYPAHIHRYQLAVFSHWYLI